MDGELPVSAQRGQGPRLRASWALLSVCLLSAAARCPPAWTGTEAISPIPPLSRTVLRSDPGLPRLSPAGLSQHGGERERKLAGLEPLPCQVAPYGRLCSSRSRFGNVPPARVPQRSERPARAGGLPASQSRLHHCGLQTAWRRHSRHLRWCRPLFHQGLGRAVVCLSPTTSPHIFCIFSQNRFAGTTEQSFEIIW